MGFGDNRPQGLLSVKRHGNDRPNGHIKRDTTFAYGGNTGGFQALVDEIRTENIAKFPKLFSVRGVTIGEGKGCG